MNVQETFSFPQESIIPLVDESTSENESPKNKLLTLLDDIENRVEHFRRGALLMEEEKDVLFSSIDSIRTSDMINDLVEGKYRKI